MLPHLQRLIGQLVHLITPSRKTGEWTGKIIFAPYAFYRFPICFFCSKSARFKSD